MGKKVVITHTKMNTKGEKVTYVYWGHSYYNKEKRRTDNKKICIGKYNERHEFVPNKTFLELPIDEQLETELIDEPYLVTHKQVDAASTIANTVSRTKHFGWVSLIEQTSEDLKLTKTLKGIFPKSYTTLMNLVESSLTLDTTLYNNRRFHEIYWDFARKLLTKYDVAQVLKEANTKKEKFFSAFEQTRPNSNEYCVCAVDSTSFSTYSTLLQLAKYGFNKDGDNLEQINVLVVCEEETGIPLFYRTVAGNVSDKKVLQHTITEMTTFDYSKKLLLVMDRGFWDKESINILNKSPYEYIICVPGTDSTYYNTIEANRNELKMPRSYIPEIERHCIVVDYDSPNTMKENNGQETVKEGNAEGRQNKIENNKIDNTKKKMSLYIYFDPDNVSGAWKKASEKFINTLRKLNAGEIKYNPKQSSFTGQYFSPIYDNNGEVIGYEDNDAAQRRCLENCGVYVCLAPRGMSKEKVHKNYKQRQKVEDGFGALKERDRRTRASNEANFEGSVFCDFLNLIVECGLRKKMHESALDKKYTLNDIKEIVDSARYYIPEGNSTEGEWIDLTQEQQIILYSMGRTDIEKQYPDVKRLADNAKDKRLGIEVKRGRKPKQN